MGGRYSRGRPARAEGSAFSNVFACLVHDDLDAVVDLVENLRFFDPDSTVLVYDGSAGKILREASTLEEIGVDVHPAPKPMSWGRLHEFAFDCLEHALGAYGFDAITFVDSDQLLARRGYSRALREAVGKNRNVGVLFTPNPSEGSDWAANVMPQEAVRWEPFRERFPGAGKSPLPQWVFWPGTVITRAVAPALLDLRGDALLAEIVDGSALVSEETVFSTLAVLLGYKVAPGPWSTRWVRWRRPLRAFEVADALADPGCFWLHPVRRSLDDAARAFLRSASNHYQGFTPVSDEFAVSVNGSGVPLAPWKDRTAERVRRVVERAALRSAPRRRPSRYS